MPDLSEQIEGLREQIAREIDPKAFMGLEEFVAWRWGSATDERRLTGASIQNGWRNIALIKADAILALLRALAVKEKDRGE